MHYLMTGGVMSELLEQQLVLEKEFLENFSEEIIQYYTSTYQLDVQSEEYYDIDFLKKSIISVAKKNGFSDIEKLNVEYIAIQLM